MAKTLVAITQDIDNLKKKYSKLDKVLLILTSKVNGLKALEGSMSVEQKNKYQDIIKGQKSLTAHKATLETELIKKGKEYKGMLTANKSTEFNWLGPKATTKMNAKGDLVVESTLMEMNAIQYPKNGKARVPLFKSPVIEIGLLGILKFEIKAVLEALLQGNNKSKGSLGIVAQASNTIGLYLTDTTKMVELSGNIQASIKSEYKVGLDIINNKPQLTSSNPFDFAMGISLFMLLEAGENLKTSYKAITGKDFPYEYKYQANAFELCVVTIDPTEIMKDPSKNPSFKIKNGKDLIRFKVWLSEFVNKVKDLIGNAIDSYIKNHPFTQLTILILDWWIVQGETDMEKIRKDKTKLKLYEKAVETAARAMIMKDPKIARALQVSKKPEEFYNKIKEQVARQSHVDAVAKLLLKTNDVKGHIASIEANYSAELINYSGVITIQEGSTFQVQMKTATDKTFTAKRIKFALKCKGIELFEYNQKNKVIDKKGAVLKSPVFKWDKSQLDKFILILQRVYEVQDLPANRNERILKLAKLYADNPQKLKSYIYYGVDTIGVGNDALKWVPVTFEVAKLITAAKLEQGYFN